MKYTGHQAKKTMGEIMQREGIGETVILSKDNPELGSNLEKILGVE